MCGGLCKGFGLAAVLIGVSVALFVACDKETANDPKMQEAAQKMKAAASTAGDAAKQAGEAIKEGAQPVIDSGKRAATRAADAVADGAEKLKEKVNESTK